MNTQRTIKNHFSANVSISEGFIEISQESPRSGDKILLHHSRIASFCEELQRAGKLAEEREKSEASVASLT